MNQRGNLLFALTALAFCVFCYLLLVERVDYAERVISGVLKAMESK